MLLYAVDTRSHAHAAAKSWLERVLSGTESVAFASSRRSRSSTQSADGDFARFPGLRWANPHDA